MCKSEKYEPWIAIRYLGAVLESSSFWVQQSHHIHQSVTKKLFERVRQLVEDLDVKGWATTDVALRRIRGDVQGVDIITFALLNGLKIWDQQAQSRPLGLFLNDFALLMEFLH
jgi:hypothetical protein